MLYLAAVVSVLLALTDTKQQQQQRETSSSSTAVPKPLQRASFASPSPSTSPSWIAAQFLSALFLCPPDVVERWMPMMAPLPSSRNELQRRQHIDTILQKHLYNSNLNNVGYEVQPMDDWLVNTNSDIGSDDSGMDPSTYGEITTTGTRQLLSAMKLTSKRRPQRYSESRSSDDDAVHFYDLGSGAGKLVLQVALEIGDSSASSFQCTGVELSPTRHEAAISAQKRMAEYFYHQNHDINDVPFDDGSVHFVQDDILQVDLSGATHIYVASLCFPPSLLMALQDKLVRECSTTMQCVATLQRFPNDLYGRPPSTQYMEMSWTKPFGSAVYVYHRKTS